MLHNHKVSRAANCPNQLFLVFYFEYAHFRFYCMFEHYMWGKSRATMPWTLLNWM